MIRVSDLPVEERPREKMIERGAAALSDAELVAILLRTAPAGHSVVELAREWLEAAGGLEGLLDSDVRTLQRQHGIGPAKATTVLAAVELGRRVARRKLENSPVLDRPELAADYIARAHGGERVELFGCLLLDSRRRLIGAPVLHRGARAHAAVEPAEVFHAAILANSDAVILWHTHPSGDCTPSQDDMDLTRRLAEAGRLMHVAVLDHLVVTRGGFVSLRQRGAFPST